MKRLLSVFGLSLAFMLGGFAGSADVEAHPVYKKERVYKAVKGGRYGKNKIFLHSQYAAHGTKIVYPARLHVKKGRYTKRTVTYKPVRLHHADYGYHGRLTATGDAFCEKTGRKFKRRAHNGKIHRGHYLACY